MTKSSMTESRMENLLRQMSLQEPSIELDERVTACLRSSDFVEDQGDALLVSQATVGLAGRDLKSWGILSAIAVVCLLLGVVLGRVTVATSLADGAGPVEDKVGAISSNQFLDRNGIFVDGAAASNLIVDIPDAAFGDQFQGPAVAMLCSLGTYSASGSTQQQCLQCHYGVTSAKSKFRKTHMSILNSELCSKCHVASRDGGLPVMDGPMPRRPWHDVDQKSSPTS